MLAISLPSGGYISDKCSDCIWSRAMCLKDNLKDF